MTSVTTGMNTDVCNFMFGSILAMSRADVILSVVVSVIVMILFVVFYRKLFAVTFDENFAKATGVKVNTYNMYYFSLYTYLILRYYIFVLFFLLNHIDIIPLYQFPN